MPARAKLGHLFCSLPWSYAEVHADGRVFMCCPRYSGLRAIGNVFKSTPEAIWNSRMAQRIRRGILKASFSHCSHRECPELVGSAFERRADAERNPDLGPLIRQRATALARGTATVNLCHDESCNLTCPSCRKETIVANGVRFALIRRWRRGLARGAYAKAMIWDEAHPGFDAVLATLCDPALAPTPSSGPPTPRRSSSARGVPARPRRPEAHADRAPAQLA